MRRLWIWGFEIAVVLALGLNATATAGETSSDNPAGKDSTSYWTRWFGSNDKTVENKAHVQKEKEREGELAEVERQHAQVDAQAGKRAAEQANLLRRLAVCDQLKLIAVEKKDDELLSQAGQLEEQTQKVYNQRMMHLDAVSKAGTGAEKQTSKSETKAKAGH